MKNALISNHLMTNNSAYPQIQERKENAMIGFRSDTLTQSSMSQAFNASFQALFKI